MTCIVGYQTKKELREAARAGLASITINDPSIFAPFDGAASEHPDILAGRSIVVTNHPKRSWFAEITANGRVV